MPSLDRSSPSKAHHPHRRQTSIALAVAASISPLLTGCATNGLAKSAWPPEDFTLEVQALDVVPGAPYELQKVQVLSDGLLVYREATAQLPSGPIVIPVFTICAVYRLDPRSLRTLTRRLDQVDLFDPSADDEISGDDVGHHVSVYWTARGAEGTVSTLSEDQRLLDDTLHIVNSFLPQDRTIDLGRALQGRSEPTHVERTPTPLDSLEGALACHLDLVRRFGDDDPALLSELFALAIFNRDFEVAGQALASLNRVLRESEEADQETRRLLIDALRRTMDEARVSEPEEPANR
ncbi:MAG: hypothetical protein AAF196_18585 [Planctomycetota bacterium]